MTQVKVCGITHPGDALAAQAAGAAAVGFVFADSPRRIDPGGAREIAGVLSKSILRVGVFVDAEREEVLQAVRTVPLDLVQLHGGESREYLESLGFPAIKAFRAGGAGVLDAIRRFGADPFLLDAYSRHTAGGTGLQVDLNMAREAGRLGSMVLAGGLGPENVAEAVTRVRPQAVDVSSGVEKEPGRKDWAKLFAFMSEVKRCDTRMNVGTSASSGDGTFPKPFSRRSGNSRGPGRT
jgi:phosphoribosylanthranilate isomerase